MTKKFFSLLVVLAAALLTVPAAATPGSGAPGTILARGNAVEKIKSHSHEPYDVVVQQITYRSRRTNGLAHPPGQPIAVVKSGALTIYDGDDPSCTGRTYGAGQVYLDPGRGHIHMGRNESATQLEILVTYLDIPVGGGVREDAPNPGNCPF